MNALINTKGTEITVISNPDFEPIEFERFRQESGYNTFTLSPQKWINSTNAVGITSKSGRYGGTFAHKDIAFDDFHFGKHRYQEIKMNITDQIQS